MRKDTAVKKSGGTGLFPATIVVVGVIAAGVYVSWDRADAPSREELASVITPPQEAPTQANAAAAPAVETTEGAGDIAKAETVGAATPSIDEVRLAADGVAVVAGKAEPGSTVAVLLDGETAATAQADAQGKFAVVGVVPPSDDARILSLSQEFAGKETASKEEIILAPLPAATEPLQEAEGEAAATADTMAATVSEPEPLAVAPAVAPAQAETATQTAVPDAIGEAPLPAPQLDIAQAPEQPVQETAVTDQAGAETAPVEAVVEPVSDAPAIAQAETARELAAQVVSDASASSGAAAQSEQIRSAEALAASRQSDAAEETSIVTVLESEKASDVETKVIDDTANASDIQTVAALVERPAKPEANLAAAAPAEQKIALLKSTEDGVELLQGNAAPVETVALDTIGYSAEGDVQLSGRAQADAAAVRIYIDNTPVTTLDVDADGRWRGDLAGVDTGVHTLRVDEVDDEGEVISRLETPFKREEPALLATASAGQTGPVSSVTVQTGDTLWAIARSRYGRGILYVKVFEANNGSIRDPDLIYPGQVFDLPN